MLIPLRISQLSLESRKGLKDKDNDVIKDKNNDKAEEKEKINNK